TAVRRSENGSVQGGFLRSTRGTGSDAGPRSRSRSRGPGCSCRTDGLRPMAKKTRPTKEDHIELGKDLARLHADLQAWSVWLSWKYPRNHQAVVRSGERRVGDRG